MEVLPFNLVCFMPLPPQPSETFTLPPKLRKRITEPNLEKLMLLICGVGEDS